MLVQKWMCGTEHTHTHIVLYYIYPLAVKVSALLAVLTLVLAPFHQIFLDWDKKKKKKVRAPMTTNDWSKSLFQLSSNYYAYKNVICLIRPFRSSLLRALLIVSNKSETKVRKNSIFVLFILRFLSVLARCIQFTLIIHIQQISLQNHTPSKFFCIVALFVYR